MQAGRLTAPVSRGVGVEELLIGLRGENRVLLWDNCYVLYKRTYDYGNHGTCLHITRLDLSFYLSPFLRRFELLLLSFIRSRMN